MFEKIGVGNNSAFGFSKIAAEMIYKKHHGKNISFAGPSGVITKNYIVLLLIGICSSHYRWCTSKWLLHPYHYIPAQKEY